MSEKLGVARPFMLLTSIVAPLGLASLAVSLRYAPPPLDLSFAVLILATLLSENFAFSLPDYSVSLSYPLCMAAIVWGGPGAAGIVAATSCTNYNELHARRSLWFIAFNFGQLVLVWTTGAFIYEWLWHAVMPASAGHVLYTFQSIDFPRILIPMAAVALYCAAGNLLLTSTAAAALGLNTLRGQSLAMLGFLPTQVALAFVGYLIAQVINLNALALPLFVAPLIVARQLYLRYAGLKDAYVDTVRSLVGALEAKDPYTRGHSERVSDYAASLGSSLGLDTRGVERLEYAALLHDIGKLAIPGAILVKPGKLDASEMSLIEEHPGRGASMIKRIPPLRDLADTILQHHEWFDGSGYPLGLAGEELSLAARVLAVADCYDAMTTTRSYRPALTRQEAVAELIRGAGTQFDPEVVRAFISSQVGAESPEREAALWQTAPDVVNIAVGGDRHAD